MCGLGQSWWTPECSKAKALVTQAQILSDLHPDMKSPVTRFKTTYKRCLKNAKLEFLRKMEVESIIEPDSAPHVWLKYSRLVRSSCPVDPDVLQEYFGKMFTASDTIPQGSPANFSVWPQQVSQWREELASPFTVVEIYDAVQSIRLKKALRS